MSYDGPQMNYDVQWARVAGIGAIGGIFLVLSAVSMFFLTGPLTVPLTIGTTIVGIGLLLLSTVVTVNETMRAYRKRKRWEELEDRRNSREFKK